MHDIYVLQCGDCGGGDYIGQRSLSIRDSLTAHVQQIPEPTTSKVPLSKHLDKCPTNTNPEFQILEPKPVRRILLDTIQSQKRKKYTVQKV